MSLQDWLSSGWVTEHRTSKREVADLLHLADRDLHDCRAAGLGPDWRLSIAYSAAFQAATAALAAAGYRASRESHHYRVVQSLAYTINAPGGLISQLDQFRKKRNIADYERAGAVSEQEAEEMIHLAQTLRDGVEQWVRAHRPDLL